MYAFLAVPVFILCVWNSRAPSHSALSCIFVVEQCDRGRVWEKRKLQDPKKKCTNGNNEKKEEREGGTKKGDKVPS